MGVGDLNPYYMAAGRTSAPGLTVQWYANVMHGLLDHL
jgi:hypothetical protein